MGDPKFFMLKFFVCFICSLMKPISAASGLGPLGVEICTCKDLVNLCNWLSHTDIPYLSMDIGIRQPGVPFPSALLIDLLMWLFRGAVFRHGGGALKQPIKQPTETPTSTLALMGRFASLKGRFPTLIGRFTDFVLRGRFTS